MSYKEAGDSVAFRCFILLVLGLVEAVYIPNVKAVRPDFKGGS